MDSTHPRYVCKSTQEGQQHFSLPQLTAESLATFAHPNGSTEVVEGFVWGLTQERGMLWWEFAEYPTTLLEPWKALARNGG